MINQKLRLLSLLLVCFLFVSAPGICAAAETYQITETELTQLQNNLETLETLNNQQLTALNQSQQDCKTLKEQLTSSQNQIQTLKTQLTILQSQSAKATSELQTAQTSLDSANKSFQQYAKEEKAKQTKLKIERDIGWIAFAVVLIRK